MSRFCKNCGSELDPGVKICPKCGAVAVDTPSTNSNASIFKLGIIISGAVLILSSFLPYVSVSVFGFSQSQSLIDGGDGFFFIALGIAAIVGAVMKLTRPTLIIGAVAAVFSVYEMINANSVLGDYAAFIDKGMGYYLNLISAIVLVVFCVLAALAEKKK